MAYSACIGPYENEECLRKRGRIENSNPFENLKNNAILVDKIDLDLETKDATVNPKAEFNWLFINSGTVSKINNLILFPLIFFCLFFKF